MANVTIKNLHLVNQTDLAIQIYTPFRKIWLPRSQIYYLKKGANTPDGRELEIEIPEWLAKKHDLKSE